LHRKGQMFLYPDCNILVKIDDVVIIRSRY